MENSNRHLNNLREIPMKRKADNRTASYMLRELKKSSYKNNYNYPRYYVNSVFPFFKNRASYILFQI